jgi:HEAT repeat protein
MRSRAAVALGLTPTPTRDTLAALHDAAMGHGPLADAALLAVGNSALRAARLDSSAAGGAVAALLARFAAAPDDVERVRVVRALGNTGDPRILPAIDQALASSSDAVRSAGVEALRLFPGPTVDSLLVRALADRDAGVRSAAVFAASYRDLAPLAAALARSARHDPASMVRRAIVDLAAERMADPSWHAIVVWAAANDRDRDVREAARWILEQVAGQ